MSDPIDASISIKNAYIPNRGAVDVIIDDERISRFSRPGENITVKAVSYTHLTLPTKRIV